MSQTSFLSEPRDEEKALQNAPRVAVLVAAPVGQPYDYAVPEGMALEVGDHVRVTLGKREVDGVVWGNASPNNPEKKIRLKPVIKHHAVPRLSEAQRAFTDWVARYTLSDPGSVLRLTLNQPDAYEPPRPQQVYALANPQPAVRLSAPRQRVISILQAGPVAMTAAALAEKANCSTTVIRAMAEGGVLISQSMAEPAPVSINPDHSPVVLSKDQVTAAQSLRDLIAKKEYAAALLDGVTGSGKTEVYFDAVAEVLREGKQALILLPEIALSTQFIRRFEQRFGQSAALWHSEVSPAQKRETWRGVATGRTQVVIGARSALFLPYADLGLIIVDEEHDASYKQEDGVMYNARDMAVVRAHLGRFPVLLVSATPSLETMVNVEQGKYHYLHLPSRHAGAQLPVMQVIDLKNDKPARQRFLSPSLLAAIASTIEAREQVALFLNRRGYAPLTLCRTCGHRFQCPSCSAWLVEHKRKNVLQCHHCGHAQPLPKACPCCNDDANLAACGPGVERIQEEITEAFPTARSLVLASDIVTTPAQMKSAIEQIENHEVDIIIGTQMIAKGHHFPDLTLVGVVDADLGLAGGDLRAGERTFQLLHQVAGRAGRAQKPGRVLIQTVMPEQQVIRALAAHDRDAFLRAEMAERQRAQMPPYGRLAALVLSGPDENALLLACRQLAQAVLRHDEIRVLGPAPAPLAFLRGRHRQRFLVKASGAASRGLVLQAYMTEWLSGVKLPSQIQIKVDIDPQSFF